MGKKEEHAIDLIIKEYHRATKMNNPFHSAHEGFAVILEEVDELKHEVWKKEHQRSKPRMTAEAVQIGAMAIRFLVDILDGGDL